ncbi:MAG: ABC transporter substrate-binding protein [Nitrobacter sp.]|uniref:ABC transporter substrate-binding protein n=1 Tax=Nitrobacter sp. TaxID=29420 RepID=UPI00262832A2|nr:ABC transporter substrate-binding protein [Nitrobacter sp.]MCV0387733.1 ABC transporter substrate-binding protein [Nitrobacter sp.]
MVGDRLGVTSLFVVIGLLGVIVGALPPHIIGSSDEPSALTAGADAAHEGFEGARRVAVLAPVLSPYATINHGLDHVTAISEFVRRTERKSLFGRLFPQLTTLPLAGLMGSDPDPELVLHANPDAVIAWQSQSDPLRKTGYQGLVEIDWASPDRLKTMWDILGRVSGREARATGLWQDAEARRRKLETLLPPGESIKVLPMAAYDDGRLWVGKKDYFLNASLQQIGGINPAREIPYHGPADPEEILLYDPDFIIFTGYDADDNLSGIYGNPVWHALRAVRDKRVYLMPRTSAFNKAVDRTLALVWLAEILHPSLPHMSRTAYREIYAQAYRRDLTDSEIDAALYVKANSGSVGYERFRAAP